MFEQEYKAANDRLHIDSGVDNKILEAMQAGSAPIRRVRSKGFAAAIAAALCVLFVAPSIIGITKLASKRNDISGKSAANSNVITLSVPEAGGKNGGSDFASADDYSAVFSKLSSGLVQIDSVDKLKNIITGSYFDDALVDYDGFRYYTEDYELMPEAAAAPADGFINEPSSGSDSDHSGTNTQVDGVDESDIIKTDGRYIYVLNSKGVTVLSAEGPDTSKIAYISADDMPKHHEDSHTSFNSMYLCGSRLVIIASEYVYNKFYEIDLENMDDDSVIYYGAGYGFYHRGASVTTVYVYNVQDASAPELISTLCQDGYYRDSRMIGSQLYVISEYDPYGFIVYDSPYTYVPCTYDGEGSCRLTPAEDICIMDGEEDTESSSYMYISAVDVETPDDFSGTLAILGYVGNIYCSTDNLYITTTVYDQTEQDISFTADEYSGIALEIGQDVDQGKLVSGGANTLIYRVKIGGRQPVLAATGKIEGSLLNQFSMDEYNGCLRVAADRDSWSYIEVILDDEDGTTYYSYDYKRTEDDNALFVLDMDMNVIAELDGMGLNEHIKSVRFMGDTCYVVTFRQTDPLYSIDLSVPTAPRVLGELHIPGFSEYLHSWNNNLLFGLGQMADEHTGGTQGLKITMFNVSDKSDVKELYTKRVGGADYSGAEYNHKLILVSPERGIIGFPAFDYDSDGSSALYYIYSFSEENGFVQKAEIKLSSTNGYWVGDMSGMYIGDYFYVISAENDYDSADVKVMVVDLNTFELAANLSFGN